MSADAMHQERLDRISIVTFAGVSRKNRLAIGTWAKKFSLLFRNGDENVELQPVLWSAGSEHKADFVLIVARGAEDVWILTIHPESPITNDVLVLTGLHYGNKGTIRQEKLGLDEGVQVMGGEVVRLVISAGSVTSEEFSMMISEEDQSLPAAQKQSLDTLPVVVHRLIAEYLPWTTWVYTLPFVSAKLFELAKAGLPFHRLYFGEIIPSTGDLQALCTEAVSTCQVLAVERQSKVPGRAESGWYPRHPHLLATVFAQFRWNHLVGLTLELAGVDRACAPNLWMAFSKGNFPVLEELSLGAMKGQPSWDVLMRARLPKLKSLTIRVEPAIRSRTAMHAGNAFWAQFTTLHRLHVLISHQDDDSAWEGLFPKPTGPILPKLRSVKISGMLTRSQETLREELSIFRHSPVQTLGLDSLGANGQRLRDAFFHDHMLNDEIGERVRPLTINGSTIAYSFPRLVNLLLQGGKYCVKWDSILEASLLARLQEIECDLLFEGAWYSPENDPRIPPYQKMKNLRTASVFLGGFIAGHSRDTYVAKLAELLSLSKLSHLTLDGVWAINILMAAVEKVQGMERNGLENISHLVLEVHQINARQTGKVPCMLERFRNLKFLRLTSAKRLRWGSGKTPMVNISTLTNAFLKKNPDWSILCGFDSVVNLGKKAPDCACGIKKLRGLQG